MMSHRRHAFSKDLQHDCVFFFNNISGHALPVLCVRANPLTKGLVKPYQCNDIIMQGHQSYRWLWLWITIFLSDDVHISTSICRVVFIFLFTPVAIVIFNFTPIYSRLRVHLFNRCFSAIFADLRDSDYLPCRCERQLWRWRSIDVWLYTCLWCLLLALCCGW